MIRAVQTFLRLDLSWRNRIRLEPRDLEVLRDLPKGVGIILVVASKYGGEVQIYQYLRSGSR